MTSKLSVGSALYSCLSTLPTFFGIPSAQLLSDLLYHFQSSTMFKHVPWASHEGEQPQEKQNEDGGESLTTILDAEQRGELTILIASATAAMRKTIESNFDPTVSWLPSDSINCCFSDPPRQLSLLSLITASPKKKRS